MGLLEDVALVLFIVLGMEALWRQIVGATFVIIVVALRANLFFTVASGITTGDKEQLLLLLLPMIWGTAWLLHLS